ncbi:hypothetical protein [Cohnella sp. 56]|uniref:hypothetical protein n=1 Tax=Cohnella sp. 56 TaxID=3113722 RepID=UPI0030E754E8
MALFTSILNLLKKNPATDGADTFNIQTMLNDNWDKIDAAMALKAINGSVRAATTNNTTLSGLQTVDGVSLAAGDRVLVKNQTTGSQNGIYIAATGAWTRAADADSSAKLTAGLLVYVREGTLNGGKGFVLSTVGTVTLGTTALTFTMLQAPLDAAGTASTAVVRDGAGRAQVAAPSAAADIARKDTVDAAIATAAADATSKANAAQSAATSAAATDAASKANAVQANLAAHIGTGGTSHAAATTSAAGFMSAADKSKLDGVTAGAGGAGTATDTVIGSRTISDTSTPTGDSGTVTTLFGWLANMIKAITGKTSWRTAPATTLEAAKSHMDATVAHGAVSAPTASTMMVRDSAGRAQVAAPSASADIARKDTVDAAISTAAADATSKANAAQSAAISAAATDAATKANVVQANLTAHIGTGGTSHAAATTSVGGFMSAADKSKLDSVTTGAGGAGTATDAVIGNRTISDTTAPTGDSGTVTTLFGWLANMIKAITGGATWRTVPVKSLAALNTEKAPLASPTFSGIPSAPTAAVDTNNTQIATTAFVKAQGYLPGTPDGLTLPDGQGIKTLNNVAGTDGFGLIQAGGTLQIGDTTNTAIVRLRSTSSPQYTDGVTTYALFTAKNFTAASQAEAESGAAVNKYMTPVLTAQAIAAQTNAKVDYIRQPGYGTTAGSANTYTLALSPGLAAYAEGVSVAIKIHAANTGASTLNVNGLGAKSILTSKGAALTSGKFVTNGVYTLRYNGSAFILQGEGGEYGTAAASQVLTGYTIGIDAGIVSGSMPNNGTISITPGASAQTIPAGYTSGGTVAGVSFDPYKVLAGVMIAGTTGMMPARANDQNSGIRWADGNGLLSVGFPTGAYLNDSGFGAGWASAAASDPNFVAANIRSGVSIFGVAGSVIAGKPYANGSIQILTSGRGQVSGLSFTPRLVIMEIPNTTYGGRYIYHADTSYPSYNTFGSYFDGGKMSSDPSWTITSDGFSGQTGFARSMMNWWAFA